MIVDSRDDRKRAIELFEQHQPGQVVRQSHPAERETQSARFEEYRIETDIAAEVENDRVRPLRAPTLDLLRELLRSPQGALLIERHEKGRPRSRRRQRFAFEPAPRAILPGSGDPALWNQMFIWDFASVAAAREAATGQSMA